jgi:hypothetical protein
VRHAQPRRGRKTAEPLATAVELGCSYAQGYHIARPMPADELVRWLAARDAGQPVPAAELVAAILSPTGAVVPAGCPRSRDRAG